MIAEVFARRALNLDARHEAGARGLMQRWASLG